MINHANALNGDSTALTDETALDADGVPADAFIYPDEPLVLDKFRAALIHPDEPFAPREEERGVVVRMDGSTEHEPVRSAVGLLDPGQVADLLEAVSMDLRKNGIDSLQNEGSGSSVETNLKTHLAEYFSRQH
jgi:hypothetical protein